eukprot:3602169-Pyramimonas_sp.AAC.3
MTQWQDEVMSRAMSDAEQRANMRRMVTQLFSACSQRAGEPPPALPPPAPGSDLSVLGSAGPWDADKCQNLASKATVRPIATTASLVDCLCSVRKELVGEMNF